MMMYCLDIFDIYLTKLVFYLCFRSFVFSPDVPIRLDYHGKFDREHVSYMYILTI